MLKMEAQLVCVLSHIGTANGNIDSRDAIAALEQLETLHYLHHAYFAACHVELGEVGLAKSHGTRVLTLKSNFSIAQFKLVHPYRDRLVWDFFKSNVETVVGVTAGAELHSKATCGISLRMVWRGPISNRSTGYQPLRVIRGQHFYRQTLISAHCIWVGHACLFPCWAS
jgi:hypothetical protein